MAITDYIPIILATSLAIYISLIDIRELRVPNRILFPGLMLVGLAMLLIAIYQGEMSRFLFAQLGGAIATTIFFVIHMLNPKGLGMGDVKFASLIGVTLSWISFPIGLIGLAVAFIAAALYSLIRFVFARHTWRRVLPFAPFMSVGLLFVEIGLFI